MNDTLSGPDLTKGVALSAVADGAMLLGHAHGEPVLLARRGDELFAIGAICTHYGAPARRRAARRRHGALPLASRLFQPAHRRGAARAGAEPGLVLARRAAGRHRVCSRKARAPRAASRLRQRPACRESVVIVGGGAAGNAAAEMLRREGYAGRITMLSADRSRALRPAQPLEGLSRGHRARGVESRCDRRSSTESTAST